MPRTPIRTRIAHILTLMVFAFLAWTMIFGPLIFLSGCANPALPAHYGGLAANRALPVLVQIQEREGDLVIAEHAGDKAAIDAGLAEVEERWAPFWTAWEAFVAAQRAWADAVERKDHASVIDALGRATVTAFCSARRALPEAVPPEVLAAAGVPCAHE